MQRSVKTAIYKWVLREVSCAWFTWREEGSIMARQLSLLQMAVTNWLFQAVKSCFRKWWTVAAEFKEQETLIRRALMRMI